MGRGNEAPLRQPIPSEASRRSTSTRAGTRSGKTWWSSSRTGAIRLLAGIVVLPVLGRPHPTRAYATSGPKSSAGTWSARYDCVEPLQDKELRYGRVEIVESTPARVHVRWSYQSCDLDYKVWGDFAVEDYYFYPDGFGTRVLTLTANPGMWVETNEFIIFTPQSGYPFDYVPANLVDMLWPEGKAAFRFPCSKGSTGAVGEAQTSAEDIPLLHRIRFGKSDPLAAIHYSPRGSSPGPAGLRAVLRPRRDGHADVLGLPLAAQPRLSDRRTRSATASARRPGTTRSYTPARPSPCAVRPAGCPMPRENWRP